MCNCKELWQLTQIMESNNIPVTRKPLPRWQGLSSSVVSGFSGPDTDRKIILNYPIVVNHKQNLISTAARCAVSLWVLLRPIIKKVIKNINLALLTTCIQSHEALCIKVRVNVKGLRFCLCRGEQLVPVPMRDIGHAVGYFMGESGEAVTKINQKRLTKWMTKI